MKRKKPKKAKTSKKRKALRSARAPARTKGAKKKTASRKKKTARKKTAKPRALRHRRRAADLTYELDMAVNPPVFTSGPGKAANYPTGDLTIDLCHKSRKVTIELIGETFAAHNPITIHPFDGDTSLYTPPTNNPAPHRSLTFHAKVRGNAANPLKQPDKYTLYFDDGSTLDPAIQNPGGNSSNY